MRARGTWRLDVSGMDERAVFVRATTPDGDELWTTPVEAVSHAGLMPRCSPPQVAGDLVLIATCGEHERGATLDQHRLHALELDGRLRWTIELDTSSPFARVPDGILALARGPEYGRQEADDPWQVVLLEPGDGSVRRRWPLKFWSQEIHAGWVKRTVRARASWCVEEDGRLAAEMTVYVRARAGSKYQPKHVSVALPYQAPAELVLTLRR